MEKRSIKMCNITDKLSDLEQQFDFASLINLITIEFINTTNIRDINDKINFALELIGNHTEVDHTYIFKVEDENEYIQNLDLYEWRARGIESFTKKLQYISKEEWKTLWGKRVIRNPISIDDIDEELSKRKKNKAICSLFKKQGIKSLLIIPLFINNKFFGFFRLDSYRKKRIWTKKEISRLSVIAKIFTEALTKRMKIKITEQKYKKAKEFNDSIIKAFPDDMFILDKHKKILWSNKKTLLENDKNNFFEGRFELIRANYNLTTTENKQICPITFVLKTKKTLELEIKAKDKHFWYAITPCNMNEEVKTVLVIRRDFTNRKEFLELEKMISLIEEITSTRNKLNITLREIN